MTQSMRAKLITVVLGAACASGAVSALATSAAAATTHQLTAAACGQIKHHGQRSQEGFPFPQERWTEKFTNNCANARVRAVVVCENNVTFADSTHYGKTINGNGTSYYTCSAIQNLVRGYAQYYNGVKWIKL